MPFAGLEGVSDMSADPACLLPLAGGFVYFDKRGDVCKISAIGSVLDTEGDKDGTQMIQFGCPLSLPAAAQKVLRPRLHPVTLASLLQSGARSFAWIAAGEDLDGTLPSPPEYGAFAYIFTNPADNRYFPVAL